jgi:ketosteroid isomerase-like protein
VKPEKSLGNEGAIRSLIDDWVSALRAKDLDKLMSHYAPGVIFFDGVAPLQNGTGYYIKNWEGYFKWFCQLLALSLAATNAHALSAIGTRARPSDGYD